MMRASMKKLEAWFGARPRREQRLLQVAMLVLIAGLLLQLNAWAVREREELSELVSQRMHDLALLRAQVEVLSRAPVVPTRVETAAVAPEIAIAEVALSRGLSLQLEPVTGGYAVRTSGEAQAIIEWLAVLHADHGLRVVQLELDAGGVLLDLSARLAPSSFAGSGRSGG